MVRYIQRKYQAYKAGQLDTRSYKKFALIVGGIAGGYLLLAIAATTMLLAGNNPPPLIPHTLEVPAEPETAQRRPNNRAPSETPAEPEDDGTFFRPPSRTNVLILGIDNVNLADVIILGSFERDSGDINLLSVPRDTFTQLPQHRIDNMTANNLWVPPSGIMKLNAVRSLGREHGVHFMREHLSEVLGIEIHYHVEVSLSAFREIVDLLGGVEIEVPRRMFYEDDCQFPPLIIDIPAGLQRLNGRQAEMFVRYREYANADLGRINAQQQFMTQLFRQALRTETIMRDPIGIARIALNHVNTDIGLDLIRYIPYINNLSPERIFTYTLPGQERRIHGASYYVPDSERVMEVVNKMFFGFEPEDEAEVVQVLAQTGTATSRTARIAVLNGARVGGVGRSAADRLYFSGFAIAHVGVYSGTRQQQTRINVREEGMGEDLLAYFSDAVIRVDNRMAQEFDIVVIVGSSEQ